MTKDSEWGEQLTGPEIKALGLPGDTPVRFKGVIYTVSDWTLNHPMEFYRLPADHPAYNVHHYNKEHGTNFVYWAGGDEAPDDWNESYGVIIRNGQQIWPKVNVDWNHIQTDRDIIGYTKKPQLVTEEASEPEMTVNHAYEARMQVQRRIEPETDEIGWMNDLAGDLNKVADILFGKEADTFTPCERTIRMCIDVLPHSKRFTTAEGYQESVKRRIEALLPKPDRAEELVKQYIREAYPKWEHVWENVGEDELNFAKWLIERGEIKG